MLRTRYILIVSLIWLFTGAAGQNHQVLYYMNLPQNHMMNPAMRPTNSVYVGLPVISGTNLNVNNNFLNYSDMFIKRGNSDSLISILHPDYDINEFIAKINKRNSFSPQIAVQTFGLGFSTKKGLYIFLDINERFEGNAVLPGDFIKLVLKGNEQFAGGTVDLSSLRMDLRYYREYGFGFSKDFSQKLRLGVRPKIFSGIFATSLDNRALEIGISDDYTHTLDADFSVNISGPVEVYMDNDQNIDSIYFDDSQFDTGHGIFNFITGTKNIGFGLDLGATYDITEKFVVSASITDLGFIKWKRDITNINANGQFVFSGFELTEVINGDKTMDDLTGEMIDSLKDAIHVNLTSSPFTTWMPAGFSIGGSYNLTKSFSVGLLSYNRFIGEQIKASLTLSANLNLGNAFSASLGYSLENQTYDNFGAGLAFRAGFFQFYLLSDRIPIKWDRITTGDNSSMIVPENWNTVNIKLGMNLSFGNRASKKNDKPMVGSEQVF